jgi:hypothetical protein
MVPTAGARAALSPEWRWAWHAGVVQIRIGQGYDIHPHSSDPARVLVLGGVRFDGAPGLT